MTTAAARQRGRVPVTPVASVAALVGVLVTAVVLAPEGASVALVGAVQVVGLVAAVAGVIHRRPARPAVWASLLSAAALYSLAWWFLVADAGPWAVAATCTAAFLALGRAVVAVGRQPERDALVDAVDVALLAIAAASASLALVSALHSDAQPGTSTAETWLAAQAAAAVVFAAAAAWSVVTGRARQGAMRWLLATAGSLVVWLLLTLGAALGPGYQPGSAVDAALVPAWTALAAAAWAPSMRAVGRTVAPTSRRFPGTLAVLGAAVTLVVLPALARYSDAEEPVPAVTAASAATVALLVLRQVLATRSARRAGGVDALTGLGTRRTLVQALAARLSEPTSPPALLCVVDLESFADVNATRGHAAGDRAAAAVAAQLSAAAPAGARTYRIRGDGFAVLAPLPPAGAPSEADDAAVAPSWVSQRLLEALAVPVEVPGGEVRLSGRVGEVVLPPLPAADPDDALAVSMAATAQLGDAELALGEAARRRLPVVTATPHMLQARHEERALAARLPSALAGGEVVPHYQPIARLGACAADDRISGYEALARWQHPERGTLGADRLVPLAERLGVVRDVDEAVLRVALADCARWRSRGAHDLAVSVNASASTLLRHDLPAVVLGSLDRAGLPGSALVLEITEGSWLSDRERIAERLHLLREQGVRVAVDDFGTGYASLDYLVSFPVDSLKVDRSLVQRIAEPACARLLRGVVDIARDLGVLALAEGAGTADQVERARALGFGAVQGVALGAAAPASSVLAAAPPLAGTAW